MRALSGRMNRSWYFLTLTIVIIVFVAISYFSPNNPHFPGEVIAIWLCVPRLHDIGRSGWIMAIPIGLEIAAVVLLLALKVPPGTLPAIFGLLVLVFLACMIVLGFIPGDVNANRYGEAPLGGLRFRRA
jgi:uncharacterized membrane protein YhaH (DUF805 family)